MNIGKQFKEGLITNNPVTVQLLGMCSTMAITTKMSNGVGMGLSVLIILTLSNIIIALLRKIIPDEVRIAASSSSSRASSRWSTFRFRRSSRTLRRRSACSSR
jgi:Na+-translocating ferredoxin:NAD+ oxidoreductase RnfE subunit